MPHRSAAQNGRIDNKTWEHTVILFVCIHLNLKSMKDSDQSSWICYLCKGSREGEHGRSIEQVFLYLHYYGTYAPLLCWAQDTEDSTNSWYRAFGEPWVQQTRTHPLLHILPIHAWHQLSLSVPPPLLLPPTGGQPMQEVMGSTAWRVCACGDV